MTDHDTHGAIRRATAQDATTTADLIATAFHALDVSAWLVPDAIERPRVLAADFQIFVEHALTHGEIDLIDDPAGRPIAAAVWFPLMTGPTPPPEDYDTRLAAACGPATARFKILDLHFDETHPHSFPHHFLAYLATHPDHQSRGLGSTLLADHHQHLDQHGVPAFLHASCARTRDLYLRHGYECLGAPFHLPDGPPMWPLWREPNGAIQPSTSDPGADDT